ncbi:MAG: exo-alpha-sialidase [Clostridia bacterium]|nr:exo-alpha-sialidase [Clostridia bacterium]
MKFQKLIAILLLITTLGGLIASCKKEDTQMPNENADGGQSTAGGANNDPNNNLQGDGWMDIWSQDPAFELLTDDASRDSNGELQDGSWFDSFSAKKNLYWTNKKDYATKFEFKDGVMYYEAGDFTGTTHEAFISRSVRQSEQFELEFRFKIDYYGNDNGVYLSYNGVRVIIYFSESWVRFNRDRGGSEPSGDIVYTDIGYDWHTYRIRVVDRVAKVYIDGKYLTSFKPESFGGDMGEVCFLAYPSNATNAAKAQVEYVSYTVLGDEGVKITSPTASEVCGKGASDVEVSVSVSSALSAQNNGVKYYLNGFYAGKSTVQNAKMTFTDLQPGVYTVYAVCGDVTSVERVFIVEESGKDQSLRYSTSAQMQSSYVLKFNVNGSGTVTAGDGIFSFSLTFGNSKLRYKTSGGTETKLTDVNGSYIAVVDGGVVWLYKDGKLLLSYRLPYEACATAVGVSGEITNLTVGAHNGTFYQKRLSGDAHLNEALDSIGYSYALEFEYTSGKEAVVQLTDGIYGVDLSFSAEGGISALLSPQKNPYTDEVATAKSGTALYRVTVSAGIAQLYADNVWLASWRMPETVTSERIFVTGSVGLVQIRETGDKFFFSGNKTDGDWNEYFGSTGDLSAIGASCLKVYSKNSEISSEISYSSTTNGEFYLLTRYFNGLGLFAGYDFDDGCFKMGLKKDSLQTVGVGKTLPASGKATLSLIAKDDRAVLYCNGQQIGEIEVGSVNGWGNAGYLCTGNATVVSYTFEGDSNVLWNTTTALIPEDWTSCFFEMEGYVYAGGEFGTFRSEDDGVTFDEISRFPKNSWNMIWLKSGKLLTLVREGTAVKKRYVAYHCTKKGTVIGGPYNIHADEDLNAYRLTMNGRVMQASSGRIFFASGETENEYMGQVWVYYSDDDGKTWVKAQTEFNQKTTGMNLQEGMIVELDDGVMRMYARNDGGFLVYSDSFDGGMTWDTEMKYSNFPSIICAFGVNKDPYTGDIYMSWEYNNTNDSNLVQYPRTRLALAVSHDNARTWEYIGVFEELNSAISSTWMHMNAGVWFTENAILATTAKSIDGVRYNYIVRIPRDNLISMARNVDLHVLREDPYAHKEGLKLFANGVLAISSDTGRVYASGKSYEIGSVNGKRTMLSAEIVADFLNGTVAVENGRAVIRVGTAEYIFEAGSKTASIAGAEKKMIFEAISEEGTVKISIEDLQNTLGLTARCSESGAILLTVEDTPIRVEYLLGLVGIR